MKTAWEAPKLGLLSFAGDKPAGEQIWAETWTPLKGHSYSESELSRQKDLNLNPGFATSLLLNPRLPDCCESQFPPV